MVEEYKRRRDEIVSGLNSISGFKCKMPGGAFYAFPNIKEFGMSSMEMMDYLLKRAHVATLYGSSFGAYGEGYLRFSYATSLDNIKRGIERIKGAVEELKS